MSQIKSVRRIVIMAAGTGGHVVPGLAIAEEMLQRGWQVSWLCTQHGMENRLLAARNNKHQQRIDSLQINFSGLRGKGLWHTVSGIGKLLLATISTYTWLGRIKPSVVLGMGGYVTVPGGWATRLRQLPLVLMNADATLLLSNRALAAFAKCILFGFAPTRNHASPCPENSLVTGNPIRAEIRSLPAPAQRYADHSGTLRILVVGGSLGAQVLNQIVPQALALIPPEQRPIVTHQSGVQHLSDLQQAYQQAGVSAQLIGFIDDMASAYASADLLICRAGAITVSEIIAAGVASILIPLVVSTTSHQRDNAEWMAQHGAAIHLPQSDLNPEALAELLAGCQREKLLAMANAARSLATPDATQQIANALERAALI